MDEVADGEFEFQVSVLVAQIVVPVPVDGASFALLLRVVLHLKDTVFADVGINDWRLRLLARHS